MNFDELPFLAKAVLTAQPLGDKTNAQIADELNAPYRFAPTDLETFTTAVKAAGASWTDLGGLVNAPALVLSTLTQALTQSDLAVVQEAIEGVKVLGKNPTTKLKEALDVAVTARTLRKVDIAARSFDGQAPETVTEADVAEVRAQAEAHLTAKNAEIEETLRTSAEREAEANRKLEEDRAIAAAQQAEREALAEEARAALLSALHE